MGRHKYRKRKSEICECENQTEGSGLFDFAKNLTKKTAEAAFKKGTAKVGRKLGEKVVDSFFKQSPIQRIESENKDLYQSPKESGHKIYEILSPAKINKKDSKENKKMRVITQQEINENLNRLLNM